MTNHQNKTKKHMSERWNARIQFPSDSNFINRITSFTNVNSKSSGNPMLVLEAEVMSPEEVEVNGELIDISGVKTKGYYSYVSTDGDEVDKEATEKMRKGIMKNLLIPLGITEEPDWENLPAKNVLGLEGKCFYSQMSGKPEEDRKNPTKEQIETAKKTGKKAIGDIQKHPVTGKPLVKYWPEIKEIFGLAPDAVAANKPY